METTLSLEKIPSLIDDAVNIGDVSEILRLKKQRDEIQLQLIANRMAGCRKEIESKKQEEIDNELMLKELTKMLQVAAIELDEVMQQAQVKGDIYNRLQFEAGICDNKKIILHQSILDLEIELDQLKQQLHGGNKNE